MQIFTHRPKDIFKSMYANRNLIYTLARGEIKGRYSGTTIGLIWSIINPLIMLTVYTFVFCVVFHARWNEEHTSRIEFAFLIYSGLIVFNFFYECINKAPYLIITNANYVKKIIFPLEILPIIYLTSALFHLFVSLSVMIFAHVIIFSSISGTIFLLPVLLLPLIFYVLGFSWVLASLGAYIRDIAQLVGIISTIIMYISPIFYPVSAVPKEFRFIITINPLTTLIEQIRDVVFFNKMPILFDLLVEYLASFIIAWIGFIWFQKTRKGFADVI